jgi:hypothetical protein
MQPQLPFTITQRSSIEALRRDITRRIRRGVYVEYGETDCGQQWAALCVADLPRAFFGVPGALVSILTGAGVCGFAAMAADGSPLIDGADLEHAIQAARFAGVREYRKMSKGAMLAAHY